MPWFLRRPLLNLLPGFNIDKTAYIGKSLILATKLDMRAHSRIGSLNFCKAIDVLMLGEHSILGTLNYITGYPTSGTEFFSHKKNRTCCLVIGAHSAITSRHFIDCTDEILIGNFTTVAGIRSQIFTHSINLKDNIQDCAPVRIGHYNFIGTNVVILPGAQLPDYCILGANAVLQSKQKELFTLYGGVPAKKIKSLEKNELQYFNRKTGFVS
jgi:acetyltransferase-like isoleucine patch superfamily enzyme